jgi:hypothetical protein
MALAWGQFQSYQLSATFSTQMYFGAETSPTAA